VSFPTSHCRKVITPLNPQSQYKNVYVINNEGHILVTNREKCMHCATKPLPASCAEASSGAIVLEGNDGQARFFRF
jgi:hypothetical protein